MVCHLEAEPILLIGVHRSEEVATDKGLAALVQNWQHQPCVNHLRLNPLTRDDAKALVEQFLKASPLAASLGQWFHQETDGHPFFLVSILQLLAEQGLLTQATAAGWKFEAQGLGQSAADLALPDALRQSVRGRLRHLPKATKNDTSMS